MEDLQVIRLSGNTIGVEAAQALADALKTKKNLKRALLSDIFTGRLLDEIPQALKALCDAFAETSLIELDLSDNAFGPAGAEPLIDYLSNNTTLEILRLNNNGLGVGGGTMIAKALQAWADKARTENRTSTLHTVICGRNRLEDGSAPFLGTAFAAHGTLRVVRMPQNGIRPDGIVKLVKGLSECKHLEHLDLQDNTFTAKGSKALARVLKNWSKLQILNLSDCLLSKRGGYAVAESLRDGSNKGLTHLHLQYNEIRGDAILVLAEAVRTHLTLLELVELNGNQFDPEMRETQALIDALAEHGHDEALDELDDMEEVDSEEEDDEEDETDEESELVEKADKAEAKEPKTVSKDTAAEDDLVNKLEKTHI
ncbi:RNI-like protein [Lichtheimia hyalospora FSU 10163]|nr:RNI-like protein [Lichtheimia hyalospora FSU 10163]